MTSKNTTPATRSVFVVGQDRMVTSLFFEKGWKVIQFSPAQADVLCFIGGSDINPQLYNQHPLKGNHVHVNAYQDERDTKAWKDRKSNQIVAGICRGGQFANVMSGGSMLQHVSGRHLDPHMVRDVLWHRDVLVSSSHHQMMVPSEDGELLAYSQNVATEAYDDLGKTKVPEYEPEVVWYEKTKSLCYQGHPEWNPNSGADYFFKLLDQVS